jgi:mannose-6-phosphate isomerase-like protein (cupin superfamily)
MQLIRSSALPYIPASHEDPASPGVLKRILLEKLDLPAGRVQMINWARLPAGRSFRRHYHQDMCEIFILLQGKAVMRVGQEEATLAKGDLVVVPEQTEHLMHNPFNQDLEYLVLGISRETGGKTIVTEAPKN